MKVLVFEDEIYSYHLVRRILEELSPDYDVIGPIPSVEFGKEYLALHNDIDLIVADVQLTDGLCFDALDSAPDNVPVIFLSSSGEHALRAFNYHSLSYILKPVDEEQMAVALQKAQRLMAANAQPASKVRYTRKPQRPTTYRERFVVKAFNGERVIALPAIQYIVSEHKSTYIVLLDSTSYPIDVSLDAVSQQLNPTRFMKVNRKYIVPIEQVFGMERLVNGKELLRLKNPKAPDIIVSRTRKAEVRKWLDGQ